MKQLDLFSFERDAKVDEVFSLEKAYDPNLKLLQCSCQMKKLA